MADHLCRTCRHADFRPIGYVRAPFCENDDSPMAGRRLRLDIDTCGEWAAKKEKADE